MSQATRGSDTASHTSVSVVGAWDQPFAGAVVLLLREARVVRRVATVERTGAGVGVSSRPGARACEAERRVPTMLGGGGGGVRGIVGGKGSEQSSSRYEGDAARSA